MVTCAKFIFISGKQFFILLPFILSKIPTWWRNRCSIVWKDHVSFIYSTVKTLRLVYKLMSRKFRVGNRVGNLNCTHVRQRVSNHLKTVLRSYWLFWKEFRIWWVLESYGESFLVFKVTTWWCKTCWKRTCEILSHVWPRLKTAKINKDMGKVTNDWPQSLVLWLNITESVIPTVPF